MPNPVTIGKLFATIFFGGLIIAAVASVVFALGGCAFGVYSGPYTRPYNYHWDTERCNFYPGNPPHVWCEDGAWDYIQGHWSAGRWVNGYWLYVGRN